MKTITIKLPEDEARELEEFIRKRNYPSKSEFIRHLIMEKLDKDSIIKRSISGIFALISRTFFLNIISFGAFLVVTSILPTHEVGIYIAVIAIQRVIAFFTDFGLGAALIQKKHDLKQEDITTAFTVQAGISLTIFITVAIFIGEFASFFKLTSSSSLCFSVMSSIASLFKA